MTKKHEEKRVLNSAKAVQEAKHSGGKWDERWQVKDTTGLSLNVKPGNSKSWIYRFSFGGKRIPPMGIGAYPEVSLKAAREIARSNAELIAKGIDPRQEKKRKAAEELAKQAEGKTFIEYAEEWITFQIESNEWISPTTISTRRNWLTDYVYPIIGHLPILEIKYSHAKKILSQKTRKGKSHLWNDSNTQASKIRSYCESIIDKGLVNLGKRGSHFNVFIYKNNLSVDFGRPKNVHISEHRPFLHYESLPDFIERLVAIQDKAPKGGRPDIDCFIFGMLACTRSKSTRTADWEDIDLKENVWIVPKEKVGKKTKRDWPIPLHPRAIKIIKAQPSAKKMKGRIFSTLNNKEFHDKNLADLLKLFPDIKAFKETDTEPDKFAVFHGMRSTMNGWAKDNKYDLDTRELMLQHLDESSTHAAYDRGNAMLKDRREIVNGYEQYAFSMVTSNKVVPLGRRAS